MAISQKPASLLSLYFDICGDATEDVASSIA